MLGGENNFAQVKTGALDPRLSRQTAFGRIDYDLTDHITVFGQAQYARSTNLAGLTFYPSNGLTINAQQNPFVPASVAARAVALGVTSFPLGFTAYDLHTNPDISMFGADNKRETQRYVVGATGDFDLLGANWKFNVGYNKGITNSSESIVNNPNSARLTQALDAVTVTTANVGTSGLQIGTVACRSTLTNPTNGCLPYNPFGMDRNSQSTINWIVGASLREQKLQEDDFKFGVSSEPFSTWAGPVSIAAGIEHRKEQASGTADPVSATAGWFTGNYFAANGSFSVTEGYLEAVVPLARDTSFGRSLDLNGALRFAHYSNFGNATTWKIGASYVPIDGFRLRGTYSRDLRAPNLGELFGGGFTTGQNMLDPANNNVRYTMPTFNLANSDLQPETARAIGFGAVVQPSFLRGVSFSVDYWAINLKKGIASLGGQNIVNVCFTTNNPLICNLITRTTSVLPGELVGRVTQIANSNINIASQKRRGIDIEFAYQTSLERIFGAGAGKLDFRLLATRYLEALTNNGFSPPVDQVGADPAKWIYTATVGYSTERVRASLTGYGFTSGTFDNTFIECTSGCPASTALYPTVANNHRPGAVFLDATIDYKVFGDVHVFVSSQNLLDKDPAQVMSVSNQGGAIPNIDYRWQTLGRTYRAGVRFKF
jgi:outer membrane receptor protein involved in Fe transport